MRVFPLHLENQRKRLDAPDFWWFSQRFYLNVLEAAVALTSGHVGSIRVLLWALGKSVKSNSDGENGSILSHIYFYLHGSIFVPSYVCLMNDIQKLFVYFKYFNLYLAENINQDYRLYNGKQNEVVF